MQLNKLFEYTAKMQDDGWTYIMNHELKHMFLHINRYPLIITILANKKEAAFEMMSWLATSRPPRLNYFTRQFHWAPSAEEPYVEYLSLPASAGPTG